MIRLTREFQALGITSIIPRTFEKGNGQIFLSLNPMHKLVEGIKHLISMVFLFLRF
jgi:hypothetical protein